MRVELGRARCAPAAALRRKLEKGQGVARGRHCCDGRASGQGVPTTIGRAAARKGAYSNGGPAQAARGAERAVVSTAINEAQSAPRGDTIAALAFREVVAAAGTAGEGAEGAEAKAARRRLRRSLPRHAGRAGGCRNAAGKKARGLRSGGRAR